MSASRFGRWLAVILFACCGSITAEVCGPSELPNDVRNCGTCGNDCTALNPRAVVACENSQCVFKRCQVGNYDLDQNGTCEYSCTPTSAQEICDNVDDDCDGQIDEGVSPPSPAAVCGVSPSAIAAECTSSVGLACVNGAWQCTFPAGVCSTGNCATATEICDTLDNNCNGQLNENVPNYGQGCASDDGLPFPGHGLCRTTGVFVCNGPVATICSAIPASCASLPGGCAEICDGTDNDCDGLIDEPFSNKGSNAGFFQKPAVTRLSSALWMYSYEASRPTSTVTAQGSGNGYVSSAPIGATLDRTRACSEPGQLPWSNLTGQEAEQVCTAMGGHLCTQSEYQTACQATASCTLGYNPRGVACTTAATGTKFCNLGPNLDSSVGAPGDQDGLLTGNDPLLQNCWADWSSLQGNTSATNKIFDITGNLREIVKVAANQYVLAGGSNLTRSPAGATCTFNGAVVDQNYRLQDSGFRCCFSSDPTL